MHHHKKSHTPDAIVLRLSCLVNSTAAGGRHAIAAGYDTKLPQYWQSRCIGTDSVAVVAMLIKSALAALTMCSQLCRAWLRECMCCKPDMHSEAFKARRLKCVHS